jgi:hypothetical protein
MSTQFTIDGADAPVGWAVVEMSTKTLPSGRISQRETQVFGMTPIRSSAEQYLELARAAGRDVYIKTILATT